MTVSLDELKLLWQFLYNTEVNQSKKFPQLIMLRDLFRQLLTQKNWSIENEKFKRLVFQFDSMIKTLNSNDINNSLLQKISDDLHTGAKGLSGLAEAISDLPIVLDTFLTTQSVNTSDDYKVLFEYGYRLYQQGEYHEAAESFALATQVLPDNHEQRLITFVWLAESLQINQSYEQLATIITQYEDDFKKNVRDPKLLQKMASILNFVGTHFYCLGNLAIAKTYYQKGYELCLLLHLPTPNELELQLSFNFITSLWEGLSADDENINNKVMVVMNFLVKYQTHYLSNLAFLKNVKEDFILTLKSMGARFFTWKFLPQAKYCYHLLQAFARLDNDELSLGSAKYANFMLAGIQQVISLKNNDDIEKTIKSCYQFLVRQLTEHYPDYEDIFLEAVDFGLMLADEIIEISEKKLAIENKYLINIFNTLLPYDFSFNTDKVLTQIGNLFVKLTTQNIFASILVEFLKKYQINLCSLPFSVKNNWQKAIFEFAKNSQDIAAKMYFYKTAYELTSQTPLEFAASEEKNLVLESVVGYCQVLYNNKNYEAATEILNTYIGVDLNDVNSDTKNNFLNILGQFANHYYLIGKEKFFNNKESKTAFAQVERYLTYLFTFNERPINQLPTFFEMLEVTKYIEALIATDRITHAKNFLAPYKNFAEENVKAFVTHLDQMINDNSKIKAITHLLNRIWSDRSTAEETPKNDTVLETVKISR